MSHRRRLIAPIITMLCLAMASAVAGTSKCPDLSGTYLLHGEDGQVQISIKQYNCDRIIIVRENNYLGTVTSEKHALALDGKEHADAPWLGARKPGKTSARFVGSELRIEIKIPGDAALTMLYSLTPGRDLQEQAFNDRRRDDRGSPSIATRQR